MSNETRTAARCPLRPGSCKMFEAAGWCAHTQELDRVRRRVERWRDRPGRTGEPSDAAADRAWLLAAVDRLREAEAREAAPDSEALRAALLSWWERYNRSEATIYTHNSETTDSLETILTALDTPASVPPAPDEASLLRNLEAGLAIALFRLHRDEGATWSTKDCAAEAWRIVWYLTHGEDGSLKRVSVPPRSESVHLLDPENNNQPVRAYYAADVEAALAATPASVPPAPTLDDGRIGRSGWHYPACWQGWVSAWFPDEWECICARLTEAAEPNHE